MNSGIALFSILIISFVLSMPVFTLIRRLFFSEWDYLKENFFWSSANVLIRKITVWVMIFVVLNVIVAVVLILLFGN